MFLLEPKAPASPKPHRHRGTLHRHRKWDRIAISPHRDQAAIAVLRADMVAAFVAGDLELYWELDRQMRQVLAQEAP
jgi:hypothetical protein